MTPLGRLQSGVPGLDTVLSGGLIAGASYIVEGRPGCGKTILANQIAFHHGAGGGRVLFTTLLAESHDRLFQFLQTLEFFDRERVGTELQFLSAFDTLEASGTDAVVTLLRREIARHRATLLVVDGLLNTRLENGSALDAKRFIASLQGHAAFASCTVLFLTSACLDDGGPEHTMVDGVIELADHLVGSRSVRRLRVRKSRGSPALAGLHEMEITGRGIVVHPRLEALVDQTPGADPDAFTGRLTSGVAGLDDIIGGGLPRASASLLLGPSGCGKTTIGLSFLGRCTPEEPGILFGFYEPPTRLVLKAAAIGVDLRALLDSGALSLLWQSPAEQLLDALGHRLREEARRLGAKRIFIDSLSAMARAGTIPGRTLDFFTALMNELRARDTTILASWEMRDLFGEDVHAPTPELSGLVDNLVLMRFMDVRAELRRVVSVLKVRDSTHDPLLRELIISSEGARLERLVEHVSGTIPIRTPLRS